MLHLIPHLGTGGAQKVFSQLSEGLKDHFLMDLYAFDASYPEIYAIDLQIESLDTKGGSSYIGKLWRLFLRIKKLNKLKQKNNYNLTISHLEGADFINVLTGADDKKIIVLHGSKLADIKYKGLYHIFRHYILIPYTVRKADKIVCVSKGISEEITAHYGAARKKLEIIYNFFDQEKIRQMARMVIKEKELEIMMEAFLVVVNCARLDIQKNQSALLDIMVLLIRENPRIKLLFIGDGSLRDELIAYSRSLGLKTWTFSESTSFSSDNNVFFLGNRDNPFSIISRSKLSLLTSGWEGFPLSLVESMICGTPVISADCPTGPREILAPGTPLEYNLEKEEFARYGILMPLLKINDNTTYKGRLMIWKDTINKALEESEMMTEYCEAGKSRSEDFSKEKITEQWISLIQKVAE